jgi:DNA (cytosine-5)-methyltransferase 1
LGIASAPEIMPLQEINRIPVIDVFAGPGGLGEGFSGFKTASDRRPFRVCLSIEKDPFAHRTLLLRSFFRQFPPGAVPSDYYGYLRNPDADDPEALDRLLDRFPEGRVARQEIRRLELGRDNDAEADRLIRKALGPASRRRSQPWVLLGGPPCQAYSMAGRSRMRPGLGETFYKDERHTLYREYLRLIRVHRPTVFVMENVKGILSSRFKSELIINQILRDLGQPEKGLQYALFSLTDSNERGDMLFDNALDPGSFVIHAEKFGVPQARHRVIILGVLAEDVRAIGRSPSRLKQVDAPTTVFDVLNGLPRLRSGLSQSEDSHGAWTNAIRSAQKQNWLAEITENGLSDVGQRIRGVIRRLASSPIVLGGRFVASLPNRHTGRQPPLPLHQWLEDPALHGVMNHQARTHMSSDLHRYLFASCYAKVRKRSPQLQDFPLALLPNHRNLKRALKSGGLFSDRFRVQRWDAPASTITSHIRKDGHYFIHPDPDQCRSLTVREAARLQTFPDNYFFEGPKTEQYQQVGNAVPPFLACQIAAIVHDWLEGSDK